MDGAHDMGGNYALAGDAGFGRVRIESEEPVFHEPWEATAFALNLLSIGKLRAYSADAYRHSIERMESDWYLRATYYERVLVGVTTLLIEAGTVNQVDLKQRAGHFAPVSSPAVAGPLPAGSGAQQGDGNTERSQARFVLGDLVRVVAQPTPGHTRCPAYARGAVGSIVAVCPTAYLPELRAHTNVKQAEHTYAVEFRADGLWTDGEPDQLVVVELFESYLVEEGAHRSSNRGSGS